MNNADKLRNTLAAGLRRKHPDWSDEAIEGEVERLHDAPRRQKQQRVQATIKESRAAVEREPAVTDLTKYDKPNEGRAEPTMDDINQLREAVRRGDVSQEHLACAWWGFTFDGALDGDADEIDKITRATGDPNLVAAARRIEGFDGDAVEAWLNEALSDITHTERSINESEFDSVLEPVSVGLLSIAKGIRADRPEALPD